MRTRRSFGFRFAAAIGGMVAMLLTAVPASRAAENVVVFAAASLKNALDPINAA